MITIYGKDNCTFCEQAKMFCQSVDQPYEYKQLGVDFEREEFIEYMREEYSVNVRSMPQIVQEGCYIGGFKELKEALS